MTLSTTTKHLIAEALGLPEEQITPQTALGVTSEWDSIAHMRLILAIEEKLGKPLGPDAIVSLTSSTDVDQMFG